MQLLYNVVLVSAVQRSESAICIHKSPPSWVSLLLSHLTLLSHHRAQSWAPYDIQQPPTSYLFTHGSIYVSILYSVFVSPSPSPPVSICPFSVSMSPFLPYRQYHLCDLSIFHQFSSVAQSCLTLCNPMNAARQASLSITNSRSSLRLMSIESVMPVNNKHI